MLVIAWAANGDYSDFGTVGNGTAEVSLTSINRCLCNNLYNAAKILGQHADNALCCNSRLYFQLNMKTTDSVSIDFDSDVDDN